MAWWHVIYFSFFCFHLDISHLFLLNLNTNSRDKSFFSFPLLHLHRPILFLLPSIEIFSSFFILFPPFLSSTHPRLSSTHPLKSNKLGFAMGGRKTTSIGNSGGSRPPICRCQKVMKMWISNTTENPKRKFWRCRFYRVVSEIVCFKYS